MEEENNLLSNVSFQATKAKFPTYEIYSIEVIE